MRQGQLIIGEPRRARGDGEKGSRWGRERDGVGRQSGNRWKQIRKERGSWREER